MADGSRVGERPRQRLSEILLFVAIFAAALLIPGGDRSAAAMSASDLVALKEVGFSDGVIQAIVREKVIETAAFTVEELIALKKAGMQDDTIKVLVTERSFMRRAQPIVYSASAKPLNLASVPDLIELKRSGMSDDVIQAVIIAASSSAGEDYDRAWNMLNRMGIEVKIRP
jgi:hypothetical protein